MLVTIIVVLSLVILIMLWSFGLYRKDKKNVGTRSPVKTKKVHHSTPIEQASLEEIVKRVARESLSEKELINLANIVANKFRIPSKSSGNSSQHHFSFIRQFCLNQNARGATIVKMSNTLKAVNPNFRTKIEEAERDAVRERDLASSRK